MTVRDLLRLLVILCSIACAILIVTTFAAPSLRDHPGALGWLVQKLDLDREENPATWFAGVLYLLLAVSFIPLIVSHRATGRFRSVVPIVLGLGAFGSVMASASEILMFHEIVAEHAANATTVFDEVDMYTPSVWGMLLFFPPVVGGLAVLACTLAGFIKKIPAHAPARRRACILLAWCCLAVPTALIAEFIVERFHVGVFILRPIEEACEITATLSLIACNTAIAQGLEL